MLNVEVRCPHCSEPVVLDSERPECCVMYANDLRKLEVHSPRPLSRRIAYLEAVVGMLWDASPASRHVPEAAKVLRRGQAA